MQMLGSMEVERIFLTLSSMKNKLWNCLKNHLCHARMHGLIHDGQLRACPSYLLGLMYGCKVNVRS